MEVGTPTVGPPVCFTGDHCAGTVLDGNYPSDTDSRITTPPIRLSSINAGEEIFLTFWQWFSYADACTCDYGVVQIQSYNESNSSWSSWNDLSNSCLDSFNWTNSKSEITEYAGQIVRIGFLHTAYSGYGCGNRSNGWYIDHIRVTNIPPEICWCDFNSDGFCNILDWPNFIEDWGQTDCSESGLTCYCDLNNDDMCNILDWPLFIEDWNKPYCPAP